MKCRKKPVIVDFIRWNGNNVTEIQLFVGKRLEVSIPPRTVQYNLDCPPEAFKIVIPTLEGDHIATKGDYIIKGVKGEFYPVKPDIFELTYEVI